MAAKPTKYCDLSLTLLNGAKLSGRFHIEARTTSTIRPSDAIREAKDGFLLLTDAKMLGPEEKCLNRTLMVPIRAIAFVDLPSSRWATPPLL